MMKTTSRRLAGLTITPCRKFITWDTIEIKPTMSQVYNL